MASYPCDLRVAPLQRDLEISRGSGFVDPLAFELNGSAMDLTGVEWELTVSDHAGGTALLLAGTAEETSGASGVIVDDATAGHATVCVTAGDVMAVGTGDHYYQVVAMFPAGHDLLPGTPRHLLHGRFRVKQDATGGV